MVSTVKPARNHYDVLGVAASASDADIAAAFTRAMSALSPRAFGGLADVSIAYEALREPTRRRAYDASIGLAPDPPAAPAAQPEWKPFMMHAAARPVVQPRAVAPPPRAEPAPPAQKAEPIIAAPPGPASKRDPRLDKFAAVAAPAPLRPPPDPEPGPSSPSAAAEDELPPNVAMGSPDVEGRPIDWVRPAAIGGGLVAAVAAVGAWAGWQASNGAPPDEAEAAVTLALPKPSPRPPASDPAPPSTVADEPPVPHEASAVVPRPVRRLERAAARPPAVPFDPPADRLADISQSLAGTAGPVLTEAEVAALPPVEPAAVGAAMPLPDAVVARTIRRIGYPCGSVASTSAVDGAAAGVFKVTCASGHAYRASPVRGRYHFRRWTGG